jgi:hypothetical protein
MYFSLTAQIGIKLKASVTTFLRKANSLPQNTVRNVNKILSEAVLYSAFVTCHFRKRTA